MTKCFLIIAVVLASTQSSCLVSLQQLATYKNIITDDKITGLWMQSGKQLSVQRLKDSKYKNLFTEARKSDAPFSVEDSVFATKIYIVSFLENGIDYTSVASLVKGGNNTFLSLKPDAPLQNGRDVSPQNSLQGYSFAKLEWHNDNYLELKFIDGGFVKDLILSGKTKIKHEYDPLFGTFIITAPAEELLQFLEKYGNDERLYRKEQDVNLIRRINS